MIPKSQSDIYFFAFRYCLGRETYVVDDFIQEATRLIREIWTQHLKLMEKEITDAERKNRLGDPFDAQNWRTLRIRIQKELINRELINGKENH